MDVTSKNMCMDDGRSTCGHGHLLVSLDMSIPCNVFCLTLRLMGFRLVTSFYYFKQFIVFIHFLMGNPSFGL
jgi:hypothetical protein